MDFKFNSTATNNNNNMVGFKPGLKYVGLSEYSKGPKYTVVDEYKPIVWGRNCNKFIAAKTSTTSNSILPTDGFLI